MKYLDEVSTIDSDDEFAPTYHSIGKMFKGFRIVDETVVKKQITSGFDKGRRVWLPKKDRLIDLINRSPFDDLKELLMQNDCPNATDSSDSPSTNKETVGSIPQELPF